MRTGKTGRKIIVSRSARTARIEIRTVPRADVTAGVAVRKDRED